MDTLLLTGFNAFGDLQVNPSALVVETLARQASTGRPDRLITEVLPTEYAAAGARIVELIRAHQPDAILMLGVSEALTAISLERVALNLDDAEAPDNAGEVRQGRLILPEGPKAYWSTLPLRHLKAELEGRGIPVVISNHAGAYVCNHVFYLARHAVAASPRSTSCGFIHVPFIAEGMSSQENGLPGLPLSTMVAAIETCIAEIQKETLEDIQQSNEGKDN